MCFTSKTKNINFNFPPKKGTGIEKLVPYASQESVELIYKMCAYDPDDRISARHALKHAYFKDIRYWTPAHCYTRAKRQT